MAGNYPDAPARRLAWDDDGTEGFAQEYTAAAWAGTPTIPDPPLMALRLLTLAEAQDLNGEDNTPGFTLGIPTVSEGGIWVYLIFPDDRDIDGYYFNIGASTSPTPWLYTSADTTTGHDGTWTTIGTLSYKTDNVNPSYRTDIKTETPTGVRGLYFGVQTTASDISTEYLELWALHLYGTPSAAGNTHRFLFLDTGNSDAEYTLPIDDGDVGRGADSAFTIKVKNNSATLQANTVQITTEALVGSSDLWYTLSDDDVTYQQTEQLGNIAALGTQLVYVKKAIPDAEDLGLHSARFKVSKASWS